MKKQSKNKENVRIRGIGIMKILAEAESGCTKEEIFKKFGITEAELRKIRNSTTPRRKQKLAELLRSNGQSARWKQHQPKKEVKEDIKSPKGLALVELSKKTEDIKYTKEVLTALAVEMFDGKTYVQKTAGIAVFSSGTQKSRRAIYKMHGNMYWRIAEGDTVFNEGFQFKVVSIKNGKANLKMERAV